MKEWVIEAQDLTKIYQMGEVEVPALRGVSLRVRRSEVISIMGLAEPGAEEEAEGDLAARHSL